MSLYKRFWRRGGHARLFAYAVRYVVVRLDRQLYRISRGRISAAVPPLFPWLLLTTTGRKSGQPRTTPLLYLRDRDSARRHLRDLRHGGAPGRLATESPGQPPGDGPDRRYGP